MPPRRNYIKLLCLGAVVGFACATLSEAASVLVGRNWHVVVPGRVYRSAQPSPSDVASMARQYGIKTIVNLRGPCIDFDWYQNECRATAANDLAQEDLTFSAGRLPTTYELKRLVEVLDRAEYPILIHCRRGVDRTGLTCTLIELLNGDDTTSARKQLGLRFGHISLGRTEAMLHFFDLYDAYRGDRPHSPLLLRQFIEHDYRPGPASGELCLAEPVKLVANRPGLIRVRATNTSHQEWHMKPGTGAGIHLQYRIIQGANKRLLTQQAGLFERVVPPGESVDLQLAVPRLTSGAYWIFAELLQDPATSFTQLGSEPLIAEFTIP